MSGKVDRVDGTQTAECPTSLITPDSRWLLEEVERGLYVGKATGSAIYGPDAGMWPAYWFDAIGVVHSARQQAESIEMSK